MMRFTALRALVLASLCLMPLAGSVGSVHAQRLGVVSNQNADTLTFFDLSTNAVAATVLSGGQQPFGLAVTPDGGTLLVANLSSQDIAFFDVTKMPPILLGPPLPIPSPCPVGGVAITPDGAFAVTSHIFCAAPTQVTSIDIAARTIVSQFTVGGAEAFDAMVTRDGGTVILNDFFTWSTLRLSPTGVLSGPRVFISSLGQAAQNSIALTPDGLRAITPNLQSGTASVLAIDALGNVTNTGTIIPIGGNPSGVAVAPNGHRAYITNAANGDLAVLAIDASANVTDTGTRIFLPQGRPTTQIGIQGIAVSDDSSRAYVPSFSNGTVSVIDLTSNSATGIVISVGSRPTEIALFTPVQEVSIDIKPGSDPSSINPRSKGVVPVGILTTSVADGDAVDFDAWDVDATTLAFGPAGAGIAHAQGHAEDVDGDGDLDLVVHFKTQDTGIACGDTEATLTGMTFGGQEIEGTDSIKTAGCGKGI